MVSKLDLLAKHSLSNDTRLRPIATLSRQQLKGYLPIPIQQGRSDCARASCCHEDRGSSLVGTSACVIAMKTTPDTEATDGRQPDAGAVAYLYLAPQLQIILYRSTSTT